MTDYWPAKLDPRPYNSQQREFIKINERVRQLEAVVEKLMERKK